MSNRVDEDPEMVEVAINRYHDLLKREKELGMLKLEDKKPEDIKIYSAKDLTDKYQEGFKDGYTKGFRDREDVYIREDELRDVQ